MNVLTEKSASILEVVLARKNVFERKKFANETIKLYTK